MVSTSSYVPDRGDVVWIDFNPQTGHEQAGRLPAVTLSPALYNGRTGLALLCPITNQIKGYPFEVTIPQAWNVTGVVLADQVKSLDWRRRDATVIARMPQKTFDNILDRLDILLGRGSTYHLGTNLKRRAVDAAQSQLIEPAAPGRPCLPLSAGQMGWASQPKRKAWRPEAHLVELVNPMRLPPLCRLDTLAVNPTYLKRPTHTPCNPIRKCSKGRFVQTEGQYFASQ